MKTLTSFTVVFRVPSIGNFTMNKQLKVWNKEDAETKATEYLNQTYKAEWEILAIEFPDK